MKSVFLALSDLFRDEDISAANMLDFTDIEGTCCYCDPDSAGELRNRLTSLPLDCIHWIDTGDYHYMTLLFMERIEEDFELLLFDHHSDRQPSAFEDPDSPMLSCGSWVARALRTLPHLKNVMTVGAGDGSTLLPGSTVPQKDHGRPWPFERVARLAVTGRSEAEGPEEVACCREEPLPLYISVDLDILSESEFVTDWDQGDMKYEELCAEISRLVTGRRILGIDVCGGITRSKGATASDLTRNALLRTRFRQFIESI